MIDDKDVVLLIFLLRTDVLMMVNGYDVLLMVNGDDVLLTVNKN